MEHVAVIVPVYNGEQFLPATLESILAQEYKDFCVYIVDDGSTDDTRTILQKYALVPRVRCIHRPNVGQAAAINSALREGREPLVAVCDADDLWRADRLAKAVAAFEADPDLGLVCNDYCLGVDPAEPWVSAWETLGLQPVSGNAFQRLLEVNFVQRSGVLLNRRELDRCGGFSEDIGGRCGCDDLDMWLKIAQENKIICLPEVLTFKRTWGGQESKSLHFLESQVRLWESWNRQLRNGPKPQYQRVRRHLAEALFDLGYCRLKGDRNRLQAYAALWGAARRGYRSVRALGLISMSIARLV